VQANPHRLAFLQDDRIPFRDRAVLWGLMGSGLLAMAAGIANMALLRATYLGYDYAYDMVLYGLALYV
jgi:hypothetical protein